MAIESESRRIRPSALRWVTLPVLHRHVLREMAGTMTIAFAAVMGLMFLVIALEAGRQAGVDASTLARLFPLAVPFGVRYAIPVSLLMAASFAFSRMAADNEILVVRAAGSTLWTLAAPVVLLAVVMCGCLMAVLMVWLPDANRSKRNLFKEAGLNMLENLPPGENSFQFGRTIIHYGGVEGRAMRDVVIHEARESDLALKIAAKEGRWAFDRESSRLRIELSGSQWTWFGGRKGSEQKFYPGLVMFSLDLENVFPAGARRASDFTLSQLLGYREVMADLPANFPRMYRWTGRDLDFEIHSRLAQSMAPLIVVLLGMPLGAMVRLRGRLAAFFAGFAPVALIYYPLVFVGEALGNGGSIPPVAAAWGADAVVGAIGAVLSFRLLFR